MFSWIDYDLNVQMYMLAAPDSIGLCKPYFLSLAWCYNHIESNRFDKTIHAERIAFQVYFQRSMSRERKKERGRKKSTKHKRQHDHQQHSHHNSIPQFKLQTNGTRSFRPANSRSAFLFIISRRIWLKSYVNFISCLVVFLCAKLFLFFLYDCNSWKMDNENKRNARRGEWKIKEICLFHTLKHRCVERSGNTHNGIKY